MSKKPIRLGLVLLAVGVATALVLPLIAQAQEQPITVEILSPRSVFTDDVDLQFRYAWTATRPRPSTASRRPGRWWLASPCNQGRNSPGTPTQARCWSTWLRASWSTSRLLTASSVPMRVAPLSSIPAEATCTLRSTPRVGIPSS